MYQDDTIQQALQSGTPADAQDAIREIDFRLRSAGGTGDTKERANLFLNKAVFLGILGRFEEAATQLELALQTESSDNEIRLQCEYIRAGMMHQEQRYDEAYAYMTAILSRYSSALTKPELQFILRDIQIYRAFELVQLARFEDALPLLRESLSYGMKSDDENTAIVNLGICCSKLRKYDEAIQWLSSALERRLTSDWEGQARCQLAIAYTHLNLLPEAKEQLEVCLQHIDEYKLPLAFVYGWLSRVQRGLGNRSEADRYSRLARPC